MKRLSLLIALMCVSSVSFADYQCNLNILIDGQRKALQSYSDITNIKIGGYENYTEHNQLIGYNLMYTYTYKNSETMVGFINFNANCNGLDSANVKAK
ncbi:MAG: hypothetical protein ACXVCP_02330 [Bdellovibrio sp.]